MKETKYESLLFSEDASEKVEAMVITMALDDDGMTVKSNGASIDKKNHEEQSDTTFARVLNRTASTTDEQVQDTQALSALSASSATAPCASGTMNKNDDQKGLPSANRQYKQAATMVMLQVNSTDADARSLASMEESAEEHKEEDASPTTVSTISTIAQTYLSNVDPAKNNAHIQSTESLQKSSVLSSTTITHVPTFTSTSSAASISGPALQVWKQDLVPLILLSLPIDSLHSIASFCSAKDWGCFGQASTGANRVCRDIFRRVRMHGFRCATEVVTAWKLGQHSDARELSALYIQAGVPIYPSSLGHSYHTMAWRLAVEAKEMALKSAQCTAEIAKVEVDAAADPALSDGDENHAPTRNPVNNNRQQAAVGADNDSESNSTHPQPIDAFYGDRYGENGSLNDDSPSLPIASYLEQKCLFYQSLEGKSGSSRSGSIDSPNNRLRSNPVASAASLGSADGDLTSDTVRQMPDAGASRSKARVKIHRHLVDQHLLGRSFVDDEQGAMRTPMVNLSADFFHAQVPKVRAASATNPFLSDSLLQPLMDMQSSANASTALYHNPAFNLGFEDDEFRSENQLEQLMLHADMVHQQQQQNSSLMPPPPQPTPDDLLSSARTDRSISDEFDLEIYSVSSTSIKTLNDVKDGTQELKSHLKNRFAVYQRRLESLMKDYDMDNVDECLLDFWDEFLPVTSNIHFYDRNTAVPRLSGLHRFLCKPVPRALGVVQCEIERIKITPKKKGVNMKGRLFPTYEYRLFIRDRRQSDRVAAESATPEESPLRRDTVLMTAKHRGKKHHDHSGVLPATGTSKKGVNNYYLYMPQQADIDFHHRAVNSSAIGLHFPNGTSTKTASRKESLDLLARLQSNFIGTEFQIFTPTLRKRSGMKKAPMERSSLGATAENENESDYDSGVSSDTPSSSRRKGRFSRRSRRSRRSNNLESGAGGSDQHPGPIEEEGRSLSPGPGPGPDNRSRRHRRSYSLPSLGYSRSSRANRKVAISNPDDPMSPSLSNEFASSSRSESQTVLCEEEDGAITYTANLLGNRPRIMDVCIPRVSEEGVAGREWKRYLASVAGDDDSNDPLAGHRMLTRFKEIQSRNSSHDGDGGAVVETEEDKIADDSSYTPPDDYGLLALQNRSPWWNIELGAFVLNFGGRVSVASVKNFQLCDRNDQEHVMLQFGRIQGRHSFTMDCQFPLTPVQAFAIAISSLQSRISFG